LFSEGARKRKQAMNTLDVLQANAVYANEEIARLKAELEHVTQQRDEFHGSLLLRVEAAERETERLRGANRGLLAERDAVNNTIAMLQARLDIAIAERNTARDTCHAAVDRVVTLLDEVIAVRGQLRGAVVLCDYCAGKGHWADQAGLDNGCEVCGGRGFVPAVQEENHD
jgi:chromosome segregation ATPase